MYHVVHHQINATTYNIRGQLIHFRFLCASGINCDVYAWAPIPLRASAFVYNSLFCGILVSHFTVRQRCREYSVSGRMVKDCGSEWTWTEEVVA